MTVQERINAMNNTIKVEQEQKKNSELNKEIERQKLITQIIAKGDRIRALINVGNKCAQAGQMPPAKMLSDSRVKDTFCTDGIHHEVGFWHEGYRYNTTFSIRYVGFENGGACGAYDFYTDGTDIFEEHEDANCKDWDMRHRWDAKRRKPTIEHMQKFLRDFDAFEEMFYAWFDKRFGVKNEKDELLEAYNLL